MINGRGVGEIIASQVRMFIGISSTEICTFFALISANNLASAIPQEVNESDEEETRLRERVDSI